MVEYCEREGITQAQFIEKIIKDELQRLDILKVKTLLCVVACQITDRLLNFVAQPRHKVAGTGSDVDLQEPEKQKPDNLRQVWRLRRRLPGPTKPYSQQFSYGEYSHMPGKVQDFFLCSLLLRIVGAGWCD